MDAYFAVGTTAAVLLILRSFLWPPLSPRDWRSPDIAHVGAGLLVVGGCNAVTETIKVGALLFRGRFAVYDGGRYEALSSEVGLIFLGGLFAILVLGLISITDGVHRLKTSPAG